MKGAWHCAQRVGQMRRLGFYIEYLVIQSVVYLIHAVNSALVSNVFQCFSYKRPCLLRFLYQTLSITCSTQHKCLFVWKVFCVKYLAFFLSWSLTLNTNGLSSETLDLFVSVLESQIKENVYCWELTLSRARLDRWPLIVLNLSK